MDQPQLKGLFMKEFCIHLKGNDMDVASNIFPCRLSVTGNRRHSVGQSGFHEDPGDNSRS